MKFTVEQIALMLNGEVEGDKSLSVSQLSKIEEGKAGSISFLSNAKYEQHLYSTQASAVIVDKDFVPRKTFITTLIRVKNAYAAFGVLLNEYEKLIKGSPTGIEQPCFISSDSTIGENAYIGAFAYIGKNCKIGNNVKIYPQVYIGDNVTIGDNATIHTGVKIYNQTVIGNRSVIFANSVIGSDGFGFAPQANGTYQRVPQLGNVIIEDDVSIGSNCTIDCATMGSTLIRAGVKLDNLIQVAHNVEIGKNTVIAAQTGIAGSTKIGENCLIGGQVGVAGHITVANGVKVGAQSGVTRRIEKENAILNGTPIMEKTDNLRSWSVFKRLPQIERKVEELEKLSENIKSQVVENT
jgi:UDP-3-O-[3-hydroxymyristoyl] glucosamine N-acyltransferase